MTADGREEQVEFAARYLREALDQINAGSPAGAIWRLADAGMALVRAEIAAAQEKGRKAEIVGFTTETGRGNLIVSTRAGGFAAKTAKPLKKAVR